MRYALLLVAVLAGCASKAPAPTNEPATAAPSTVDVQLTVKNEAADARLVWVESYRAGPTDAPLGTTELGTLAAGESVTRTVAVPQGGSFRVVGAKPTGDQGDKRVVFMGSITKATATANVRVNR